MVSYLLTNTVAGSHPTAYTLTAIVYYVLRTPGVYSRLNRELDESQMKKTLPISWEAARKLQYMEAVVRETIRIHPAFALTLERVVPDEGLHLPDGRYVTGGTIVGMNPWVINQSEKLFGPQCGKFIPERWLPDPGEPAKEFEMRRKKMINSILSFGAGPRTCTGQHLAIMEIFKTTASFFVAFDVRPLRYMISCSRHTNGISVSLGSTCMSGSRVESNEFVDAPDRECAHRSTPKGGCSSALTAYNAFSLRPAGC